MVRKLQTWLAVALVAVLAAVMLGHSLAGANPDKTDRVAIRERGGRRPRR